MQDVVDRGKAATVGVGVLRTTPVCQVYYFNE